MVFSYSLNYSFYRHMWYFRLNFLPVPPVLLYHLESSRYQYFQFFFLQIEWKKWTSNKNYYEMSYKKAFRLEERKILNSNSTKGNIINFCFPTTLFIVLTILFQQFYKLRGILHSRNTGVWNLCTSSCIQ